jgi:hypothetical protein
LNGRNYLDLALLVPGVSPTNTGSNQRFAETSAVPGQGISIAGQRNLYNSFVVDGVSANDDAADLTGTYYSEEVIDQFQVVTSGGIAEFGRASGGVVNILTKSGTNDLRGSLYGFFRNQRFDARNPIAPTKDLLTQAQYGFSLGGPLHRDRTFFFSNFEQTRRNYSAVVTVEPGSANAINNRLRAVNYAGPLISTGVVPASFDATNFFTRIDHSINQRNLLSARYSLYHINAVNSRSVGGLNAVSRGTGLDNTDQTLVVSNVTTISSRTLNEARVQYTNSRLDAPVNDPIGPAITISGVANLGASSSSPTRRDLDLYELVDTRGLHIILSRNVNVPTLSAADATRLGVPNLGRPNPNFGNISRYESSGDSYYNALTVSLNRRFRSWAGLRVSYTFSKAIDDTGTAFFFTPQDNFNLRDDRGRSDNDQRYVLAVSGTFAASKTKSDAAKWRNAVAGLQLSYIFRYGSALPFNIQTGNDRNNDTNANDRPLAIGRNTGVGFDFASFDLRLSRHIHITEHVGLEMILEGFNLLNRANLQLPNNTFGTGTTPNQTFRQPTGAADPRQVQFGLRLSF